MTTNKTDHPLRTKKPNATSRKGVHHEIQEPQLRASNLLDMRATNVLLPNLTISLRGILHLAAHYEFVQIDTPHAC
jgi:hypothetical protein